MYSGSNACGKSTAPGSGITGSCFGKVTREDMTALRYEAQTLRQKYNDEIRMTKSESMTNDEARSIALFSFGLRHYFVIRASSFFRFRAREVVRARVALRCRSRRRRMHKSEPSRHARAARAKLRRVCQSPLRQQED